MCHLSVCSEPRERGVSHVKGATPVRSRLIRYKIRHACRIKPLKETNLGVAQALFDA